MPILFDGAMGRYLQDIIGDLGAYPELLNKERATVIKEIHQAYARAGAEIITSNTLTISPARAVAGGYELESLLTKSLVNAFSSGKPVALDVGPLGRMLEPYGDMSPDDVYAEFAAIISLGATVVDYVLLETFADLRETELALRAANERCSKPVFATMTFNSDGVSYMGATVEQFAACANMYAANAIGFNCTVNPDEGHVIFERFQACTDIPLIVQPNQLDDPNAFADAMMWYVERGAAYVGGCCGTTPDHIKALADRIQEFVV